MGIAFKGEKRVSGKRRKRDEREVRDGGIAWTRLKQCWGMIGPDIPTVNVRDFKYK